MKQKQQTIDSLLMIIKDIQSGNIDNLDARIKELYYQNIFDTKSIIKEQLLDENDNNDILSYIKYIVEEQVKIYNQRIAPDPTSKQIALFELFKSLKSVNIRLHILITLLSNKDTVCSFIMFQELYQFFVRIKIANKYKQELQSQNKLFWNYYLLRKSLDRKVTRSYQLYLELLNRTELSFDFSNQIFDEINQLSAEGNAGARFILARLSDPYFSNSSARKTIEFLKAIDFEKARQPYILAFVKQHPLARLDMLKFDLIESFLNFSRSKKSQSHFFKIIEQYFDELIKFSASKSSINSDIFIYIELLETIIDSFSNRKIVFKIKNIFRNELGNILSNSITNIELNDDNYNTLKRLTMKFGYRSLESQLLKHFFDKEDDLVEKIFKATETIQFLRNLSHKLKSDIMGESTTKAIYLYNIEILKLIPSFQRIFETNPALRPKFEEIFVDAFIYTYRYQANLLKKHPARIRVHYTQQHNIYSWLKDPCSINLYKFAIFLLQNKQDPESILAFFYLSLTASGADKNVGRTAIRYLDSLQTNEINYNKLLTLNNLIQSVNEIQEEIYIKFTNHLRNAPLAKKILCWVLLGGPKAKHGKINNDFQSIFPKEIIKQILDFICDFEDITLDTITKREPSSDLIALIRAANSNEKAQNSYVARIQNEANSLALGLPT